jgi:molecular chaperone GrpE
MLSNKKNLNNYLCAPWHWCWAEVTTWHGWVPWQTSCTIGRKLRIERMSNEQEAVHDKNAETSAEKAAEMQHEAEQLSTTEPEAAEALSPEADEAAKLRAELDEMQKKYLYLLSEFENYKRRTAKERLDLFKTASKDLLVELLPVLDDFERGLQAMEVSTDVAAVKTGVDLVYNKFKGVLTGKGLQPIESVGSDFDTELHEAISQAPAAEEAQKNKVMAEVEKGYKLNEQVIRYAKVIVGV